MNGKRYSRQRELIYEALRQTEQHPTAEMIYQWLKLSQSQPEPGNCLPESKPFGR
ncbi:MAG: transcriptional repressor [Flavonifractor plautii]